MCELVIHCGPGDNKFYLLRLRTLKIVSRLNWNKMSHALFRRARCRQKTVHHVLERCNLVIYIGYFVDGCHERFTVNNTFADFTS